MQGPYFTTTLEADVIIRPNQMNNNIMDNIKRNLEEKYSNKCYNRYGYIDKIYEIGDDIKGGIIRAEDNTASSVHRVKFKCRICNPVKNSIVVGKIIGINNMIILAENGPIKFIIAANNLNTKNIQFRVSAYYPISAKGEIIDKPISKGTYVMIKIESKKLVNGQNSIITIGSLESVVSDANINNAIRSQYESQEHINADKLLHIDNESTADSHFVTSDENTDDIESEDE